MLTNKWIQFTLSLLVVVFGFLAAYPWQSLLDQKTAGVVSMVIGAAKMVLNALAPASGTNVTSTGNSIVTHTSTPGPS